MGGRKIIFLFQNIIYNVDENRFDFDVAKRVEAE